MAGGGAGAGGERRRAAGGSCGAAGGEGAGSAAGDGPTERKEQTLRTRLTRGSGGHPELVEAAQQIGGSRCPSDII